MAISHFFPKMSRILNCRKRREHWTVPFYYIPPASFFPWNAGHLWESSLIRLFFWLKPTRLNYSKSIDQNGICLLWQLPFVWTEMTKFPLCWFWAMGVGAGREDEIWLLPVSTAQADRLGKTIAPDSSACSAMVETCQFLPKQDLFTATCHFPPSPELPPRQVGVQDCKLSISC